VLVAGVEGLMIALYTLPFVLLAFALHEMAHAFTAIWFGDQTPARYGRKTLNPIPHLDPIGTIMLTVSLLLFLAPMGFAVTPINESNMRNPRWHGALVALAGPVTNVILAALFAVLAAAAIESDLHRTIIVVLLVSAGFNAFLTVFNLLPIPPLDGARIVGAFMDEHTRTQWRKVDEYGIFIILALILFGGASFTQFIGGLQDMLLGVVCSVVDCPTTLD
jgi:Zn-dependent protease